MKFFQYLFFNQYAEISRRGGESRKAQLNTILLSTVVITLLLILCLLLYGKYHPGFLEKYFSSSGLSGKSIGKLMGAVVGVVIFFILKLFIGTKTWYDQQVDLFNGMSREEQDRVSKIGLQYFVFAFLPVIVGFVWLLV